MLYQESLEFSPDTSDTDYYFNKHISADGAQEQLKVGNGRLLLAGQKKPLKLISWTIKISGVRV